MSGESGRLFISRIAIANFKGIDDFVFEPGSVNIVSGANGVGKTSFLRAVAMLGYRKSAPEFIGPAGDKAVITWTLSDGNSIRLSITKKGNNWTFSNAETGTSGQLTRTLLEGLLNFDALDPWSMISGSAADLEKRLRTTLPIPVPIEKMRGVLGSKFEISDDGVNGFEAVARAEKRVDELLRDQRASLRECESRAAQLEANVPDEERVDVAGLRTQLADIEADVAARSSRIDLDTMDKNNEIARQIRELQAAHSANLLAASGAKHDIMMSVSDETASLRKLIQSADSINERVAKGEEVARIAKEEREKAGKTAARIEKLVAAREGLRNIRAELMNEIPIKGLIFTDDGIRVGPPLTKTEIPLDQLNDGQRFSVGLALCQLQSHGLGLIVVDNGSELDITRMKRVAKFAKSHGLQMFVSRTSKGALRTVKVDPDSASLEDDIASAGGE